MIAQPVLMPAMPANHVVFKDWVIVQSKILPPKYTIKDIKGRIRISSTILSPNIKQFPHELGQAPHSPAAANTPDGINKPTKIAATRIKGIILLLLLIF